MYSRALTIWTVLIAVNLMGLRPVPSAAEEQNANLTANPSFESPGSRPTLPEGWRGPADIFSRDESVHRDGNASLKYVNANADRYGLGSQPVEVRPGWKYRFSVWVKTEGIAGDESGATVCMEWSDKQGKWLGGCYPSGVKGTSDWRRVEGITRIPKEAGSVRLTCYVRRGMTGTAWFDDVELIRVADPPMRSMVFSPVYRGRITAAGPKEVLARVRLDLTDYELKPESLEVEGRLRTADGTAVPVQITPERAADSPEVIDVRFPCGSLAVGRYDLELRLLGPDGKELARDLHRIERVPDDFHPPVTIDQHRRLLVDGRPFFPLGMYFSSVKEEDLEVYSQSKFNCLMPYGSPKREQMDLAQRHGLKVIYSIKDWYVGSRWCPKSIKSPADEESMVRRRVAEFRDHPALLAWYLNDELPQTFLPQLEAHHRWVAEEDPGHPTWVVLYQYREVGAYLNTFDAIGTDPYPIGRKPASMAAEWTAETRRQVGGARPMWQVPQLHNWANYHKVAPDAKQPHTPTYDEVRSMAWQCICEGATGLVFYSWYDIHRNPDVPFDVEWEGLKRIAAEIDRHAPALLSVEPAPEVTVTNKPGWLHVLVRRSGGTCYVFAANDGDGEGQVEFRLPFRPASVRELSEDRAVEVRGTGFVVASRKLGVRVYEVREGE